MMLAFEDRYTPQRRLSEVGEAGQVRLLKAEVQLPAEPGAMLALSYLHRAGVGRANVSSLHVAEPCPHASFFKHAGPAMVGIGAWRALEGIRSALNQEGT